ncbi:SMI1/KNR4 family protein [Cytobacillus oceanisediminis]|uniref:SMI1/KNR4 family protein n=1 Tax=Cytobacillus TaxID=2675230 RepID=UPI001C24694C|nr:SMI1/KNR4 family protein [Cytobacillus oceanisediminis]MBU8730734.1 SMI1/KNR4 family protein [Cytobacillus oceanisediminis]MBY0157744.1 SMI1/KNR4 family protein [Cytobacillus firmus]MCM3391841.1 SMI1/KNR4 family protein [Cytobacillus oceanisediminis]MCM3528749.1 SMI1/KNR4 family protein [Cytobacillus oceanisediminis]
MAKFDFVKNGKHKFIKLQESELLNAEERLGFTLPNELRNFYLEVGYGFIKGINGNAINRIMDPDTIADITLREDIYEFDPDLENIYEEEDKLVFFEKNEGVYLTLDLNTSNYTPVYFFGIKIADSLEEFIRKIDEDDEYFMAMVD